MARTISDESRKRIAELLGLIIEEIELLKFFVVDAEDMTELIIVSRQIKRERSLSRSLDVRFTECMETLVGNMKSVSESDARILAYSLDVADQQQKWKEALDKFYGVTNG